MTPPASSQGSASAARGRDGLPCACPGPLRCAGKAALPDPGPAPHCPAWCSPPAVSAAEPSPSPVIDTSSDFKLRKASLIDWGD